MNDFVLSVYPQLILIGIFIIPFVHYLTLYFIKAEGRYWVNSHLGNAFLFGSIMFLNLVIYWFKV
jgi:hypothetical protein